MCLVVPASHELQFISMSEILYHIIWYTILSNTCMCMELFKWATQSWITAAFDNLKSSYAWTSSTRFSYAVVGYVT